MDKLSFDLINFDLAHRVFPENSCSFIVHMSGVAVPTDTIPAFDTLYGDRVGQTNDFEAVAFYSDFTRLVNGYVLTPVMRQHIMGYFQISFNTDPAIDLMCAEAFQPKKTKGTKLTSKDSKRAKNYNKPILTTHCKNCDTQDIRLKLLKKLTTCNEIDLMKFNKFTSNLKVENSLMFTLPPPAEMDLDLYNDLMTVMQKREQDEFEFINVVLPNHLDRIKTAWYESTHVTMEVFNVPNTESDTSL